MSHETHLNFLQDKNGKTGIWAWLFTIDHKRIGLMYMYAIGFFFTVAMLLGLLMKIELIAPGQTIMGPDLYNRVFTLHGVIMIFLFIIPGIPAVFGNFFLPILLGTDDVAFPRLNTFSFWLYVIGAIFALSTLIFGESADTGWTFYAPYSVKTGTDVTTTVFAAFILGFSSILTGLNFIVTIHRLRAKGMGWFRMPLYAWSTYATGWIQLLATPVVGITLMMVIAERFFGIGFFDPALGGDPILYQHLFWIYSHPAVYIMILPAMAVMSEIIPTFSRRRIFGYKFIAFSSMAIAFVGYFVWAHHMFTSGMSGEAKIIFSFLTFIVAIPSAIKVFNWLATMYKGSIELKPPMLYALGFIFLFLIGGLTGLVNGAVATDIHVHDTYFVVGHFHYVMFGGTGFGFFAAMHYWYPKMFGKMYNHKVATIAFWIIMVGFNTLYGLMLVMGMQGLPRRYYDYPEEFQLLNSISSVGAIILVIGLVLMFVNLIRGSRKGEPVGMNPWGGLTLEWKTQSPPILHNFDFEPVITEGPYEYHRHDNPELYKDEENSEEA